MKEPDRFSRQMKEMRNELAMSQLAEDVSQTVTDQGLTITAIQTIQDKNRFCALFEVTAEDTDMQITSDCSLDYTLDFGGNEDPFDARSWGFLSEFDQEISNTRYFEIEGTKNEESSGDLVMNLHFTGLRGEPDVKAGESEMLISGNWDFTLNLHTSDVISHEVDRVYELDELTALYPAGVRYEDGAIVDEGIMIPLIEGFRNEEETYELLLPFNKVVDSERITALFIGDVVVEL